MKSDKKIVLLAGKGDSTNIIYHALAKDFNIARVIIEDGVDTKSFLKRRVKNLGYNKVLGQILFKVLVDKPLSVISKGRVKAILQHAGLVNTPIPEDIILRVNSVNEEATIEALINLEPDVVVVNGTRIISKAVLNSINAKFINMHAGITPLYRGVHGGYWALAEGDLKNCGVTVHFVDSGIDTGTILYQTCITPEKDDNFTTYPVLQLAAGIPFLKKAINDVLKDQVKLITPPEGKSGLWYHPTFSSYIWQWIRRGVK
ncbi:formyl transferase [Adhaeribacter terreus]|uniref:phosphoribosylglycinamide formyltransferase 1 n=1 Tax=Adhaeribacter terreus TaxID=529703 RepID=A0ABW0E4V2_9BACT